MCQNPHPGVSPAELQWPVNTLPARSEQVGVSSRYSTALCWSTRVDFLCSERKCFPRVGCFKVVLKSNCILLSVADISLPRISVEIKTGGLEGESECLSQCLFFKEFFLYILEWSSKISALSPVGQASLRARRPPGPQGNNHISFSAEVSINTHSQPVQTSTATVKFAASIAN